jgi:predicted transposase YdaD
MHQEIQCRKGGLIVANNAQNQVYDNLLKRLIEGQFEEVIPFLFADLHPIKIEELTIEVLLPPRRMDKVYLITTSSGKLILHLEIEVAPKGRGPLSRRMLVYHSLLLEKYNEKDENIPILTYVLYPFSMPKGEPGVLEEFESEELLRFRHREVSLRTLDAHLFTQAHAVPLYGLLPAMNCTSEELLKQAVEDMVQYYENRGDTDHLRDELLCFQTLLKRAKRLPAVQIESVLRRVHMFDQLLEEDPWVQGYGDKREAKGEAKGKAEGKAEATRQNIELELIRKRQF